MNGEWPPAGKHLNDFGGDWATYQAHCYAEYERDFLDGTPTWPVPNKRFAIKRQPLVNGLCHTFWHIISEGPDEESRVPDLSRCERVCWPRFILDEFARRVCPINGVWDPAVFIREWFSRTVQRR